MNYHTFKDLGQKSPSDSSSYGALFSDSHIQPGASRAAQHFVSYGSNVPSNENRPAFIQDIAVVDLAKHFKNLGVALSEPAKSEEALLKNLKTLQLTLSEASRSSNFLKMEANLAANSITNRRIIGLQGEFPKFSHSKKIAKEPSIPKAEGSFAKAPPGFENLGSFTQTNFFELDDNFATQSFVASDRLLSIWVEGMNSLRVESDIRPIAIPSDRTDRSVHRELEREVDTIISNYARFKAYDYAGQSFKLTFGGLFFAPFETLVSEYLTLPPRSSVLFLDELKQLLVDQAADGPKFRRRWGELVVDSSGDLLLRLNKMKRRKASDLFKK